MSQRLLTPGQRVAARVATGPLAHLYAGLVDWAVMLSRYAGARVRARLRGSRAAG